MIKCIIYIKFYIGLNIICIWFIKIMKKKFVLKLIFFGVVDGLEVYVVFFGVYFLYFVYYFSKIGGYIF